MEILESDLTFYEPGKIYIYKSILNTNDNFRDKVILKLDSYNYGATLDIPAILYINNVEPNSHCNTGVSDLSLDILSSNIKILKEKNEMNKNSNNIIRLDTNKPVFSETIKVFINTLKENNVSVVGIYITNFKYFEPVECGNGINTPIMFKENSVLVIKNKLKELAEEFNISIIAKFKFRTNYDSLDCKRVVIR